MTDLPALEAQIKAEWNTIRAWVATHQTAALIIALAVAWCAGHWHLPI